MKGINQAELEKKLDLVIQKLMNLGGPEDEKELEAGGEKIGFFRRDFGIKEWDWPQGIGLYGLLKIMKVKKNQEYRDFLYHWFEDNIREGLPSKNINTTTPLLTLAEFNEECKNPEFEKLCLIYGIRKGSFASTEIADQNEMATSFVSRLYTLVLGRKWDRAGLDAWTGQLVRHETGAGELSKGFFFSPEFTNRKLSNREFVTICYKTYLNREPDQAGLNAWVKLMNQGSSADEILNGFINSQEFGKLCASYGIEK